MKIWNWVQNDMMQCTLSLRNEKYTTQQSWMIYYVNFIITVKPHTYNQFRYVILRLIIIISHITLYKKETFKFLNKCGRNVFYRRSRDHIYSFNFFFFFYVRNYHYSSSNLSIEMKQNKSCFHLFLWTRWTNLLEFNHRLKFVLFFFNHL